VHFVQRTTCGTQGVVRAVNAEEILVTGLCNTGATVRYIQSRPWDSLTLIETAVRPDGYGGEDTACGDLIEGRLRGQAVDEKSVIERVMNSTAGKYFDGRDPVAFPPGDAPLFCHIDRFDFAMLVQRRGAQLVAVKIQA
jgi:2-phosphosulfolactate phosphatase